MRIIEAEDKDKDKDADTQALSTIKSDVLRLRKKIADLKLQIDDTEKSNLEDEKKKVALDSMKAQLKSLERDLQDKQRSTYNINISKQAKEKEKKEALKEQILKEEFWRYEEEYSELVEYCLKTDFGKYLYEGRLGDLLKTKLTLIRQIAAQAQAKLSDILKVFLNKDIFLFFSKIGWSLIKLFELVKKGWEIYQKITTFIPDLIAKKFFETKAGKWVQEKGRILEEWLDAHPYIKTVSRILLVALLVFAFLYGGSSGNPIDDFDLTDFILAFTGALTFVMFITTERGFQFLYFMALGALGLSFPWAFAKPIQCAVMLIVTAAKYLKIYIKKQQTKKGIEEPLDKDATTLLARA